MAAAQSPVCVTRTRTRNELWGAVKIIVAGGLVQVSWVAVLGSLNKLDNVNFYMMSYALRCAKLISFYDMHDLDSTAFSICSLAHLKFGRVHVRSCGWSVFNLYQLTPMIRAALFPDTVFEFVLSLRPAPSSPRCLAPDLPLSSLPFPVLPRVPCAAYRVPLPSPPPPLLLSSPSSFIPRSSAM